MITERKRNYWSQGFKDPKFGQRRQAETVLTRTEWSVKPWIESTDCKIVLVQGNIRATLN